MKTGSIKKALEETNRRRSIQDDYNKEHKITPRTVKRAAEAKLVPEDVAEAALEEAGVDISSLPKDRKKLKAELNRVRNEMLDFAKKREFEQAALLRDKLMAMERLLLLR